MNEIKTGGPAFPVWRTVPAVSHIEVSDTGQIRTWIAVEAIGELQRELMLLNRKSGEVK